MTKAEFIEQKRLTDPMWYAQHIEFNANGEQAIEQQENKPIAEVMNAYSGKVIEVADKYFKVGVLGCLVVMTIAIVIFTIKHK